MRILLLSFVLHCPSVACMQQINIYVQLGVWGPGNLIETLCKRGTHYMLKEGARRHH
jgi:hypothetical protein